MQDKKQQDKKQPVGKVRLHLSIPVSRVPLADYTFSHIATNNTTLGAQVPPSPCDVNDSDMFATPELTPTNGSVTVHFCSPLRSSFENYKTWRSPDPLEPKTLRLRTLRLGESRRLRDESESPSETPRHLPKPEPLTPGPLSPRITPRGFESGSINISLHSVAGPFESTQGDDIKREGRRGRTLLKSPRENERFFATENKSVEWWTFLKNQEPGSPVFGTRCLKTRGFDSKEPKTLRLRRLRLSEINATTHWQVDEGVTSPCQTPRDLPKPKPLDIGSINSIDLCSRPVRSPNRRLFQNGCKPVDVCPSLSALTSMHSLKSLSLGALPTLEHPKPQKRRQVVSPSRSRTSSSGGQPMRKSSSYAADLNSKGFSPRRHDSVNSIRRL
eukprot:gb/GEZN01008847.1/.p1 GENE.gb/GEZN01008847.1/~~gb/GEZN01008847.1/.p1  ORF type:complete len:386 (-),score=11.92 gb/GEZN01008847.1/:150-1307(-)